MTPKQSIKQQAANSIKKSAPFGLTAAINRTRAFGLKRVYAKILLFLLVLNRRATDSDSSNLVFLGSDLRCMKRSFSISPDMEPIEINRALFLRFWRFVLLL